MSVALETNKMLAKHANQLGIKLQALIVEMHEGLEDDLGSVREVRINFRVAIICLKVHLLIIMKIKRNSS